MRYLLLFFIYTSLYLAGDFITSNFFYSKSDYRTGVLDDFYHHKLKPEQDIMVNYGPELFRLCTNSYGFRVFCEKKNINKKKYKYALIGDSYTEGLYNYEDVFTGIFEKKFPDSINIGASSYSNIIYFSKIFYLIEKENFSFEEVILFFDPTDIYQDQNLYLNEDNSIKGESREFSEGINLVFSRTKFKNFLFENFKLSHYIFVNLRDRIFPTKMVVFNNPAMDWSIYNESIYFNKRSVKESIDYSLSFLYKLSDYLKQKGIRFSIVIYPHPTELLHSTKNSKITKIFNDFCVSRCFKFINIHDFLFEEIETSNVIDVYKKYFIFRDNHLNLEGNKKFSEILFMYY